MMRDSTSQAVLVPPTLSEVETDAVRDQLARLLADAAFRSSKRYPDFLRYTVEQALKGDTENIKERVLGVEVFGREADYDTSSDPVVRMTAGEVRKRLLHYYRVEGRENELRIDYPRGSYVPEFTWPQSDPVPAAIPLHVEPAPKIRQGRARVVAYVVALVAIIAVCGWSEFGNRQTALDRFWAPVFNSKSPVLLCIPDITSMGVIRDAANPSGESTNTRSATTNSPSNDLALNTLNSQALSPLQAIKLMPVGWQRDEVSFVDSFTVMKVASALTKKSRDFRLMHTEDATLDDLKQGPVVLIGGTNNPWINQVSSELRFALAKDGPLDYIADSQNRSSRQWGITWNHPTTDYAIVSRIYDVTTGQPVVIAAGVHRTGTEAAGECFSNPSCLDQAEKMAPGDWSRNNIQFIVQTQVINGVPGQPKVIAAYTFH